MVRLGYLLLNPNSYLYKLSKNARILIHDNWLSLKHLGTVCTTDVNAEQLKQNVFVNNPQLKLLITGPRSACHFAESLL